jgi:hypothetical protein
VAWRGDEVINESIGLLTARLEPGVAIGWSGERIAIVNESDESE